MHGLSGGLQYNIFEILILIILILVAILIVQTLMRNYKGISKAGGFDDDEEYAGGATSVKYKKLKMEDKDLDKVQDGKKKVDVRLDRPTFEAIEKDSYILYFSKERDLLVKVLKKAKYDNLDDLLKKEKLEDIFPDLEVPAGEDKDAYIRKLFLSKKEGGLGYYKEEDLSKPFISIKIKPMHE